MIAADELRTFAVFAETVSLSAAARALHLTQPAVHAHLKRISQRLGGAALPPRRRGLVLTREGIELAAFARDAVERAAALEARLRGERENTRVVLATGAGALVHVLSPGIRAFTRRADGARDPLSGRVDGRGGDPPRHCPRRRRRDGQRSRRARGASSDGGRAGPRGAQGAPPREATPRPSVGARWRELRLAAGGGVLSARRSTLPSPPRTGCASIVRLPHKAGRWSSASWSWAWGWAS
ncbi:MAG: LysR family transcriptional regulator [Labilithrix sp.]|nr:LysR family transcriptional regulator [Labilithrix sp.]